MTEQRQTFIFLNSYTLFLCIGVTNALWLVGLRAHNRQGVAILNAATGLPAGEEFGNWHALATAAVLFLGVALTQIVATGHYRDRADPSAIGHLHFIKWGGLDIPLWSTLIAATVTCAVFALLVPPALTSPVRTVALGLSFLTVALLLAGRLAKATFKHLPILE